MFEIHLGICEASFSYEGLYCAVDLLRKTEDGLNSLSEINRLIGIISHVAELRRVIDRQIIVKKRPGGGSKIDSINV